LTNHWPDYQGQPRAYTFAPLNWPAQTSPANYLGWIGIYI